jgi:RNA polymerase sigma factor (sigma-70 family)
LKDQRAKTICLQNSSRDIELWNSFKNGDVKAFEQLFRDHYPGLRQYGVRLNRDHNLVEDTIQDLFVELWQSKSGVQVNSVKAYLFKALKFKIFKAIKKTLQTRSLEEEIDMDFDLSHENLLISRADEIKRIEGLNKAIQELSNRQKEIIYLKIQQGLSYEEISDVMHLNYQVCRNLFSQALKSLRKLMTGLQD